MYEAKALFLHVVGVAEPVDAW